MEAEWRALNRANWDERVPLHLTASSYDLSLLRAGCSRLDAIVEGELGPVDGLRVLHLQCHFGRDSLILAQHGAEVVGVDFSEPAIATAKALAGELGLADRARFVCSDVYAAADAVAEDGTFDRVFVTWGAIGWLPDIRGWARIVARFLNPGGALYFAEGHPAALVLDDAVPGVDGMPGWFISYFHKGALILDNASDYADTTAVLRNARTHQWQHPLSEVVTALLDAGLTLRWLHEHDRVVWPMFSCLVEEPPAMWRWPDRCWLPLAYSLWAERPR